MKQLLTCSLFLLLALSAHARQAVNVKLQQELDSILTVDQHYRTLMYKLEGNKQVQDSLSNAYKVSIAHLPGYIWKMQSSIDSSNMVRIEQIIQQYGYPGKSLVGSPANEAVFYVLQHSSKIKQYISYVEKAAKQNELPFKLYAMMLDRLLMSEGKTQIYGTQASGFSTINKETGKEDWVYIIWPVKDPKKVNALRKEAGFDSTIEENAKRLGVDYKVMTLEEAIKLRGH